MKATAVIVRNLLGTYGQYRIPFFQRHYSWKHGQWEQLWADVVREAGTAPDSQHFLGPLVCTPASQAPTELPSFQLIDGQQRLTTLTLLLAALRDEARTIEGEDLAEDISESFLIHRRKKGLERLRVVPRVGDREALIAILDGEPAREYRQLGVVKAYRHFRRWINEDVDATEAAGQERMHLLLNAITAKIVVVVITIDDDNPYEIFESLNSKGLPLEQSDLIRNFVFMHVPLLEQDAFFEEHWQPFEVLFDETDDYYAIPQTPFYRNFLMRNGAYGTLRATYSDFKEHWQGDERPREERMQDLARFARFELMLERAVGNRGQGDRLSAGAAERPRCLHGQAPALCPSRFARPRGAVPRGSSLGRG